MGFQEHRELLGVSDMFLLAQTYNLYLQHPRSACATVQLYHTEH